MSVDSDLSRVREVLLDLVRDDPGYMKTPAPVAVVKQLNDYNVVMELRAWLDDERRHIEARTNLREAVFVALTEAGIDMPFETFRLAPLTIQQGAA